MKTKIYIMTHKQCSKPDGDIYVQLQVGSVLNKDLGYLRDDVGENISDLNPYFGELTGFYWIWKNVKDEDIVGVCHYRRFFGVNGHFITGQECEEMLLKSDIICSNIVETNNKSYSEDFSEAHNLNDLLLVGEAIKELYPDDVDAFDRYLMGSDFTYGNLCIMRKPIFDNYCEWLFNIFTWIMDKIEFSSYDEYHKRVFGFLSENLIRVFAKSRDLVVTPGKVYITEEKVETRELKTAIFQLLKERQIEKARDIFISYLKYRPDVLLPLSDISGELGMLAEIVNSKSDEGINNIYKHTESLEELINFYKEGKKNDEYIDCNKS